MRANRAVKKVIVKEIVENGSDAFQNLTNFAGVCVNAGARYAGVGTSHLTPPYLSMSCVVSPSG